MVDLQSILLEMLRVPAGPAGEGLPRLDEGDWQRLLRETPGPLHPWLDHAIERRLAPGQVPPVVVGALSEARRGAAVGHILRTTVLRRLLASLERSDVTAVVLKGAALAGLCYPEPALRPMGDLDLWITTDDLDRAVDAAREVGLDYSPRLRNRIPAAMDLRREMTRVLECPRSGVVVEMHGQIHSLDDMSPAWRERAWSRRERRQLGDFAAWVMHPEDTLTHLLIHCGRNDRFRAGLRPLLDISLWIHREGERIEWARLVDEWQQEEVAVWAVLTLRLASDLLGARVPAALAPHIEVSADFARLRDLARRQVLGSLLILPPAMGHLVSLPVPERVAWLFKRLTAHYWHGPPGAHRTRRQVVGAAADRMGHDLRYRLAPYIRGLLDGQFLGSDFQRRREIAVGRKQLGELVEQVESLRGHPE